MSVNRTPKNAGGDRIFGMIAAWAGMLLSVQAHALSLGGIEVESALDEPLRAEIPLDSVDSETLESLEVTLGSARDFRRADVPRLEFLQQLEFTVSARENGPVVKVTTPQPVKEPFLHFLIAAQWNGGKLVREYTGLLDPPLYTAGAPTSVELPAVAEATRQTGAVSTEVSGSTDTGSDSLVGTMLEMGGQTAEFGPTQKGDTLWGIASKLDTGPIQANVFQIMIALLRENPDAFVNNNINRLKIDQILRLQDTALVASVSPEEASAVYTAQLEEWQSYKTTLAAAGEEVKIAGDTASVAMTEDVTVDSGATTPPTDSAAETDTAATESTAESEPDTAATESTAEPEPEQDDVLRIVQATLDESAQSESAGADSDASGEIAELRGRIATLEESLESRNLENQELRERARLLESQLQNAQRLVKIESGDLAAAQQQAAERQAAEESTEESDTSARGDGADGPVVAADTTASATQDSKVRKVVNRAPWTSWSGWISGMFLSNRTWMMSAGVGVIVLLLGLLMIVRRRQSMAEFEKSVLSGTASDSATETADSAETSASETSFLSDFGTTGMGTMQTDEVDPLAEAEVYLAYGRDEQAEEVLKEAARRNPERSEIKLKLLEIYKQRNDVKSFETIAEELYPAGDREDPEVWRQVNAMGRELNPDNPLFQEQESAETADVPGSPTGAATDSGSESAGSGATLDFDMDEPGSEPTQTATESGLKGSEMQGLDLDSETETPTSGSGGDSVLNLEESLPEQTPRKPDPATRSYPTPDEQVDLEPDIEQGTGRRAGTESTDVEGGPSREAAWEKEDLESATLDFPTGDDSEIEFDLTFDESSVQQLPESGDDSALESDLVGEDRERTREPGEGLLEFESDNIPPEETWAGPSTDVPHTSDEDALSSSPSDDIEPTDAPPYDEVETKLDLARAYLDMGDKVGARSIIDEVMREGDPAQRDRAAELASEL